MGAGRIHTFSRLQHTVTTHKLAMDRRSIHCNWHSVSTGPLRRAEREVHQPYRPRVSDTVPGVLLSSTYRGEVGQRTMKARNPRPIRARNMPATFPILSLGPPPFPLQLGLGTRRRTGAPVAFSLIRCAPPIPGRPLIGTVITLLSRWSRPRDTMIERRRAVPGTPETRNCNPSPAARLDQYRG